MKRRMDFSFFFFSFFTHSAALPSNYNNTIMTSCWFFHYHIKLKKKILSDHHLMLPSEKDKSVSVKVAWDQTVTCESRRRCQVQVQVCFLFCFVFSDGLNDDWCRHVIIVIISMASCSVHVCIFISWAGLRVDQGGVCVCGGWGGRAPVRQRLT